jgi:protein-tyrosine-phosphatase
MTKIKKILFLCSGNTCRSPFAEYYAKFLKQTKYKDDLKDVEFDSAGLYHYYERPQEGTINYLKLKGIELIGFKAKEVDQTLINKQDLILGFEKKWHVDKLKRRFKSVKDLKNKTFLLREYAGHKSDLEIPDPFYLKGKEYIAILKQIEASVEEVLKKIIAVNKK